MAVTRKSASPVSSDRRKWRMVFDALVQTINKQQSQLASLVKERTLLEDRIRLLHEKWESDVGFLKDQIFRMKGEMKFRDMVHSLEAAKLDLAVALKERESLLHKLKSDQADDELTDLKACFDILSQKCSDQNNDETNEKNDHHGMHQRVFNLEDEVKRLKVDCEKLVGEKESEVSALLAEKKFVWNQYKILETDLSNKLKSKTADLELANEKISKVITSMEELQARNSEKDDEIGNLKKKLVEMEAVLGKKNDQLNFLTIEMDFLRKTMVTPVLRRCKTKRKVGVTANRLGHVKKEMSASQCPHPLKYSEKGGRISKRKDAAVICLDDTPKLFSSSFKVPKLKASVVR